MSAPAKRHGVSAADRLKRLLSNHRFAVAVLLLLVSAAYPLLFPVVNLTSGELKPRGTFISENAIVSNLYNQGFAHSHLQQAEEMHTAFMAAAPKSPQEAADFFRHRLKALDLDVDVQTYYVQRGRLDAMYRIADVALDAARGAEARYNVYAVLRARNDTVAQDSVFLASSYPTHAVQARPPVRARSQSNVGVAAGTETAWTGLGRVGVPHAAFLTLAVLGRLQEVRWRGKDVVVLLTGDETGSIDACTDQAIEQTLASGLSMSSGCSTPDRSTGHLHSPGMAAWLRMWQYDGLEEARARLVDEATSHASIKSWWEWAAVHLDAWTGDVHSKLTSRWRSGGQWPSWVRPANFTAGPIRGGAFLSVPPSYLAPERATVLAPGSRGIMPELDMYTLAEKAWHVGYGTDVVLPGMKLAIPLDKQESDGKGEATQGPAPPAPVPDLGGLHIPQAGHPRPTRHRAVYGDTLEGIFTAAHKTVARHKATINSVLNQVVSVGRGTLGLPLHPLSVEDVDMWLEHLHTLARFTAMQVWGSSGPHGPLLAANMQAVTLQAVMPAVPPLESEVTDARISESREAAVRMGKSLEKLTRALTGLDERMHASPPFFILMSRDQFTGLTEYVISTGLAYLPLLIIVLHDLPTRAGAAYGVATMALALLFGLLSYALLVNEALLGAVHGLLGPMVNYLLQAGSSMATSAGVAWVLAVSVLELGVAAVVMPAWAGLWHKLLAAYGQALVPATAFGPTAPRDAAPLAPVQPVGTRSALTFAWLCLGYSAFPLLYLNWPLLMLVSWPVGLLLVIYGWLVTAADKRAEGRGPHGSRAPWALLLDPNIQATILWLLASPANILFDVACNGPSTLASLGNALAVARKLHVLDGNLIVPVLTMLVLPVHVAMMARNVPTAQ